jgi:hypothetical protein
VLRRRKTEATPAAATPAADTEALLAYVEASYARPGWSPLETRPGDRLIEPPRSPALPPLTARAGSLAVRFRAVHLAATGSSLTGDEGRAVLARVGHTFRRADADELHRLRLAGLLLDALDAAAASVAVGVDTVGKAATRYGLDTPPLAPLSGVEVPPLSAGYLAAFGSAVDRALELRDALARGGPVRWSA